MVDFERGKKAVTRFDVVERTQDEKGQPYSLVALYPITGRSHQLRVHMLALGHPILGDRLYAHEEALSMAPRLQLHAESLSFSHPTHGHWQHFQTPIPFSHYRPEALSLSIE